MSSLSITREWATGGAGRGGGKRGKTASTGWGRERLDKINLICCWKKSKMNLLNLEMVKIRNLYSAYISLALSSKDENSLRLHTASKNRKKISAQHTPSAIRGMNQWTWAAAWASKSSSSSTSAGGWLQLQGVLLLLKEINLHQAFEQRWGPRGINPTPCGMSRSLQTVSGKKKRRRRRRREKARRSQFKYKSWWNGRALSHHNCQCLHEKPHATRQLNHIWLTLECCLSDCRPTPPGRLNFSLERTEYSVLTFA